MGSAHRRSADVLLKTVSTASFLRNFGIMRTGAQIRIRPSAQILFACLLGFTAMVCPGWGQEIWAEGRSDFVRQVRVLETASLGDPSPAGLAFSNRADTFLVLETPGASPPEFSDIAVLSHVEELLGTVRIAASVRVLSKTESSGD